MTIILTQVHISADWVKSHCRFLSADEVEVYKLVYRDIDLLTFDPNLNAYPRLGN